MLGFKSIILVYYDNLIVQCFYFIYRSLLNKLNDHHLKSSASSILGLNPLSKEQNGAKRPEPAACACAD